MIAQFVLAALFLVHGIVLVVLPTPVRMHMASLIGGSTFSRFIGVAEVLAALGLTLPVWTGLMPWLVPAAAIGLVPIMAGAGYLHARKAFWPQAGFDAVLLAFIVAIVYLTV